MKRRQLIQALGAGLAVACVPVALIRGQNEDQARAGDPPMTREDWQRLLPPERFEILFNERTERAWTSPLNDEKRAGTYVCAACFSPLFSSDHKFDSGTGWPSFTQPIRPDAVGTKRDFRLIWPRTEYHCATCGGHQGHVFEDGPPPTGQRWCNNGLALEFVPEGEALPEIRA